MAIDIVTLMDRVASHAAASGYFERVNQHEPKSSPGNGLTAAVWVQRISPAAGQSGLRSTTVRVGLTLRIYSSMTQEPQDAIDPNLVTAASALMGTYSGDFELGAAVRNVDLLGAHGPALEAVAGYLTIGTQMYRVMDITIPLIVNDAWEQAP